MLQFWNGEWAWGRGSEIGGGAGVEGGYGLGDVGIWNLYEILPIYIKWHSIALHSLFVINYVQLC